MRVLVNHNMELAAMSKAYDPHPECPRRLTALQREAKLGEAMMIATALQRRAAHWTLYGHDIHRALDHLQRYIRAMHEPIFELTTQRQRGTSRMHAYYLRYVGCTESSDMEKELQNIHHS